MKELNKKIIRCWSLVLVLVMCISLFAGCAKENTSVTDLDESSMQNDGNSIKSGTLLTTVYEDVLYIADPDGEVHTANFFGEVYSEQTSMDGYKYIVVDDDNYRLLYFNGEEILTLADQVAVAAMSADGSSVAYITVTDEENNISELRLYADGEEKVIATDTIMMCAISPDGSAVGYTTSDESRNYRTYYWNGDDEIHEIGTAKPIIAISNGGQYIYYAQLDDYGGTDGYYVQHGDDNASKVKMADNFGEDAIFFNSDGSELLFSDGVNTYIFAKGEMRFEVSERDLFPQFPEGVAQCRSDHIGGGIVTYSAASFAEQFYLLGEVSYYGDFLYLDENYQADTIVTRCSVEAIHICTDGKTAFFRIGPSMEYQYEYYRGNHENANAYAKENHGYEIGTYRIHCGKAAEEPVLLYKEPWLVISDNEYVHYYEKIEVVWDEEASDYRMHQFYYEVDISKKDPQPVKLETKDVLYDKIHGVLLCNAGRNAIPEGAKISTNLNGRIIYWLDGAFYSYDGKDTQPVTGLESYLEAYNFDHTEIWYTFYGTQEQYSKYMVEVTDSHQYDNIQYTIAFIESDEQRDEKEIIVYEDQDAPIYSYGNIFIAFPGEEENSQSANDNEKSSLAGCYFSIDGIHFMPLVENYIADNN